MTFHHLVENLRASCISPEDGGKGIFGKNTSSRDVIECNKRAAMHIHGQAHGGLTPRLLGDVAHIKKLRDSAMDALDTQLCAALPTRYHALQRAQRVLRVGARRDPAFSPPEPREQRLKETDDEYKEHLRLVWWPAFEEFAMIVLANRHTHAHKATCVTGPRGKTGCRFCGTRAPIPSRRCSSPDHIPVRPLLLRSSVGTRQYGNNMSRDTSDHSEV